MLLNQTIDSLYLRLFSCSPCSQYLQNSLVDWRSYKENYDYAHPEKFFVDLPNLGRFRLLPCGHTPYEFVLTNDEIGDIRLYNPEKFISKSAIETGQLYIDFRSKYLQCQTDDYGLVSQFLENCYKIFFQTKTETAWIKVSRVDLAADFKDFDFTWQDLNLLCTRARKKDGLNTFASISDLEAVRDVLSKHLPQMCDKGGDKDSSPKIDFKEIKLTSSQIQILLELTNHAIDNPLLSRAIFGKELQTAYIGRFASKIYARIYVKSNEIKLSGKDYLYAYWKEKGWTDREKVIRVEFSLSGDFLKEFWASDDNSQSWEYFKENINALWTYCTSDWLRHTTGENSLNSRSPNSEFWDCVSSAFNPDHNFLRLPVPAPPTESLAGQLFAQAKGCIKSGISLIVGGYQMAFGRKDSPDWSTSGIVSILVEELAKELHDDITLEDIADRRSHYGCDEFSDTQFSAALRKHRLKLGRGS